MTDDSQWRMVVRESGGSVFTTTTRPTTTLFCCYDDETTFPGENGCTAVPSNRRPSSGHPDTIRPRARFPFAKGSDSAYRTRESHTHNTFYLHQLCLLFMVGPSFHLICLPFGARDVRLQKKKSLLSSKCNNADNGGDGE